MSDAAAVEAIAVDKHGRPEILVGSACTFLVRNVRPCKLRAKDGSNFCSNHQPDVLEAARQLAKLQFADGPPKKGEHKAKGPDAAPTKRVSSSQRRMLNPLAKQHCVAAFAPVSELAAPLAALAPGQLEHVFAIPSLPLHIDIGCARGLCMQQSALRDRGSNFLGVELRPDLVEIANSWSRARCPARNLHFVSGNINACIASLTAALPSCNGVARVSIQFPDPWSRRRHRRRRIVQPELAQALHSCMRVGGEVYVSSDVENILDDARRAFLADSLFRLCGANEASTRVPDARPALESNDVESDSDSEADVEYQEETVADAPSSAYDDSPLDPAVQGSAAQSMQLVPTDANGYLTISPLLVLSEREKVCETLWRRVYRLVFVKL